MKAESENDPSGSGDFVGCSEKKESSVNSIAKRLSKIAKSEAVGSCSSAIETIKNFARWIREFDCSARKVRRKIIVLRSNAPEPTDEAGPSSPVWVFCQNQQRVLQTKLFDQLISDHLPRLTESLLKLSTIFNDPSIFVHNHFHQIDNLNDFDSIKDILQDIRASFLKIEILLDSEYVHQGNQDLPEDWHSRGRIMTFGRLLQALSKLNRRLIQPMKNLVHALLSFLDHSVLVHQPYAQDNKAQHMLRWSTLAESVSDKIASALKDVPRLIQWLNRSEYDIIQYHSDEL
ncbi:hypothetical protein O181_058493, partial [Austropuccinia psidii MF-1]|nr:hypothetical protein [Austropuccinia psidii MF-1]